jgi:tRNA pseudouridine55 synthase
LQRTAIGPWGDPCPRGADAARPPDASQSIALQGDALLPWLPSRQLSDEDLGQMKAALAIPIGTVLPPQWPLPEAFIDPEAPIRLFHGGRLMFLAKRCNERLSAITAFPGGI